MCLKSLQYIKKKEKKHLNNLAQILYNTVKYLTPRQTEYCIEVVCRMCKSH